MIIQSSVTILASSLSVKDQLRYVFRGATTPNIVSLRQMDAKILTPALLALPSTTRADQNTGVALLKFPMRTAMHGKSRVSSVISVWNNLQNFKWFSHLWR